MGFRFVSLGVFAAGVLAGGAAVAFAPIALAQPRIDLTLPWPVVKEPAHFPCDVRDAKGSGKSPCDPTPPAPVIGMTNMSATTGGNVQKVSRAPEVGGTPVPMIAVTLYQGDGTKDRMQTLFIPESAAGYDLVTCKLDLVTGHC